MEAVRDFIAVEDSGRGIAPAGPSGVAGVQGVDTALALVREVASTAAEDAALWDFREAADFAGTVEELSRALDYLQLVGAGAVDRTRKQATTAPKADTAWTTGWRDDSTYGTAGPGNASGAVAADGETAWATGWRDDSGQGSTGPDDASGAVAASGSEVAAGAGDAPRLYPDPEVPRVPRIPAWPRTTGTGTPRSSCGRGCGSAPPRPAAGSSLAGDLLPRQGFSGDPLPPAREELGAAVAAGEVSSRAATIITLALDRVRHTCDPEAAAGMEHALTRTAAENDPDLLTRAARSWTDALDQDGAEPTEELLRQLQGAFIRKPRHGLQHLEIFATPEQFEHLLTVMNNATNPRTTHTETPAAPGDEEGAALGGTAFGGAAACEGSSGAAGTPENDPGAACLDLRSRPQKRLDGLVGACQSRPRRRRPARRRRAPPAGHGHHRLPRPPRPPRTHHRRRRPDRKQPGRHPSQSGHGTSLPARRTEGAHRHDALHRPCHRRHGPEDRLRRGHHPGPARRRRPDPGHRTGLTRLSAPHPQSPHRPRPGLRLPRLHHPRPVVRSPPHHLLVPRRTHRNRERRHCSVHTTTT